MLAVLMVVIPEVRMKCVKNKNWSLSINMSNELLREWEGL